MRHDEFGARAFWAESRAPPRRSRCLKRSTRWHSERWDSLAFQFPNWSLRLPGLDYDGADPDGFSGNRDVAARIVKYAPVTKTPVRTGVEVVSLTAAGGGFSASTVDGAITARNVVLATGPYQRPKVPQLAKDLPPDVFQVHSSRYRNPGPAAAGGGAGRRQRRVGRTDRRGTGPVRSHRLPGECPGECPGVVTTGT